MFIGLGCCSSSMRCLFNSARTFDISEFCFNNFHCSINLITSTSHYPVSRGPLFPILNRKPPTLSSLETTVPSLLVEKVLGSRVHLEKTASYTAKSGTVDRDLWFPYQHTVCQHFSDNHNISCFRCHVNNELDGAERLGCQVQGKTGFPDA